MNELFNDENGPVFPVNNIKYLNTVNLSIEDIFSGYDKLYAMTYSYSINFIEKISKYFNYIELIIGMADADDTDLWTIGAMNEIILEELKPYVTKKEYNIYKLYDQGRIKFYKTKKISHGKLFLLESENNKRVISGSANASLNAFSSRQNEINFSMDNDNEGFEAMMKIYHDTRNLSDEPIAKECFVFDGKRAKFSDTDLFKKVINSKVIVINDVSSIKEKSIIDMSLDLKKRKEDVEKLISEKDLIKENGKILLTAEKFKRIGEREKEVENTSNEEIPCDLIINLKNKHVLIDGENVINNYDNKLAEKDLEIFNNHLEGFVRYNFTGDVDKHIFQYYKLLNYMFVSPFFSIFRNLYLRRDNLNEIDKYPLFAVIYGQSGGGKTNTIKLILKMMSEKVNIISNEKFTNTVFKEFRMNYKGLPVYMDDVKENPWKNNSSDIIKNDEFGKKDEGYSCFILSLNNIGSVVDEVKRRCAMFYIDSRHRDSNRFYAFGDKISKGITNNFYKKYLTNIIDVVEKKYQEAIADNEQEIKIDLLNESSKVICKIAENNNKYFKEINWFDYFDTLYTSNKGIDNLITAYKSNKKSFKKIRKNDEIIYVNEVNFESQNKSICNELPADFEAKANSKGIMMKYSVLKKEFSKRNVKI